MTRQKFNTAAGKPALEFEELTGLAGIAGIYKYPQGMTAAQYDVYSNFTAPAQDCYETAGTDHRLVKVAEPSPELMTRMQREWKKLVDLNPVLKKVPVDVQDGLSLHDAISGVACALNPDDISLFVGMRRKLGVASLKTFAQAIPGYLQLDWEVGQLTSHVPEWFPAPETLEKMRGQLQQRGKNPASEAPRPKT